MRLFTVVPVDSASANKEIAALDEAAVLYAVGNIDCREADVFEDGSYKFSLRLDASGVWSILQREQSAMRRASSAA